jgi:diaminopimelate epimerase
VAAFLGGAASPLKVRLDGGELTIEITDDLNVTLIGTASRVYAATLDEAFVAALGSA